MGKLDRLKKVGQGVSTKEQIASVELAISTKSRQAEYEKIAVDEIEFNPANDYAEYDTEEDIDNLARSLERSGLLHNIVVSRRSDGKLCLISGSRRLRAIRKLRADPEKNANGKWDTVMCQVYSGLSVREEMIFLDAANLEARGAGGEEKMVRTATVRYVENLKNQYNVSDDAARELAKKIIGQDPRTVDRNLSIQRNLKKALRDMLDEKFISKAEAERFVTMSPDEQDAATCALETLRAADNSGALSQELKRLKNGLVDVCREDNEHERATLLERVTAQALACAGAYRAAPVSTPAAPKKSIATASVREGYLDKCDRMHRQIEMLSRPKTVRLIQGFDAAAEPGKNIRARLDELSEALENLKTLLDGTE